MSNDHRPHYFLAEWITPGDDLLTADLCIYGGTAAGIAAAVTAARRGLKAILLHPGSHLGGMTSGGLGWTDFGNKAAVGGLSLQFYRDAGKFYGKDVEWTFAPSAAAAVFGDWLAQSQVPVYRYQYLDQVVMSGRRIVELVLLGGRRVRARTFIDATYEGDLLAAAGVSFCVGREGNDVYGETLNGIQVRDLHQFSHPVDPYVIPGDATSGLLPWIDAEDRTQQIGQGDHRVQAYNFRVCMTDDPELKRDWQQPDGFDPLQYELAARWFAGDKDAYNEQLRPGKDLICKIDPLANRTPGGYDKTDTNNHGPVSSDYIGCSHPWPLADYATRERLFQQHVTYQQGLYWFLANDDRIPARYRAAYARWGLPADEFTDTGHWPHQLYVREGRRLVSDYVLTEADCRHQRRCHDSVGLASYTMDSHNCSRFVRAGRVYNEGDVQVPPADPYRISYRALVPRPGEADNLLVSVCVSTSHIAYGSLRMEPVFMVLAESCALAAEIAVRNDCSVQDVPYAQLRPRLDEANQNLDWT